MVIAIVTVLVGLVSMATLPVAQFPNIVPPVVQVSTTYTGADAVTVEESVAVPLQQQVSGVDNMTYMYSVNANNGQMTLYVNFSLATDSNTDQVLTYMRVGQAESQLPESVQTYGLTTQKSTSSPLMVLTLFSPDKTFDSLFLANYATINLNDALLRIDGISQVTVFGAGSYAMRIWLDPDKLAKLNITTNEVIAAIQAQNTVNPSGQIGGDPVPEGQEFTYSVSAQGRLVTEQEFGDIIIRANSDGSFVRVSDVANVTLGAQTYNLQGRYNGQPAAVLALYQLPGSNAVDAARQVRAYMKEAAERFPAGLEYSVALDTTEAVTEGMQDIVKTLFEALGLVIVVVFVFLQSWRATLIPLVAVPVSLVGTFAIFPLLGFSINTLSLFGLVLAIGLVVDDAIVVVEAVEQHIERGKSPRDATLAAMSEVTGPVIAIALILTAVFVPTIFIPGITGEMYKQFAITIAISVLISAFNALTLSPALAAMLLRPRKEVRGPLGAFFNWFNKSFGSFVNGYVSICRMGIRKMALSLIIFLGIIVAAGGLGKIIPPGFLPQEDQGYLFAFIQLPEASSLQRTAVTSAEVEKKLMAIEGVEAVTTVVGYNLLSSAAMTYSGFFFITLEPWSERTKPNLSIDAITKEAQAAISSVPDGIGFPFPPPPIPGIGTAGGVTFMLEDRAGNTVEWLAEQTQTFIEAATKRPEIAMAQTTFLPSVPQLYANVDREKAMKQGVDLSDAYQALQAFMGGTFVNYFNRFGRTWQVYVEAEGEFRTEAENINQFYVRNSSGDPVPLSSIVNMEQKVGPEFTITFNLYRSAQINVVPNPGFSGLQVMTALEEVFQDEMPVSEMGYDYSGMSFQVKQATEGVPASAIFGLSLLFVFLILAAQYESWTLPVSVLFSTPIAVFGAFLALKMRGMENNLYAQIGMVMLIGLAAKNAILIVEFCKDEYEKGKELLEATLAGARLRIRPILMTAFAFILGCVPLWIATGSGAVSRRILGTTVIGGMLAASVIGIFLIPIGFYLIEKKFPTKAADEEKPDPGKEPVASDSSKS